MSVQPPKKLRSELSRGIHRLATWACVPPLLIGIYGADLHKLSIHTASVIFASPLEWRELAVAVDMALAGTLSICAAIATVCAARLPAAALVPFLLMVTFTGLMTIALVTHFDETSLLHYQRYMGGNAALFFATLFFCNREWKVRLVWSMWLAAGLLQSLIAIWYWREAYMWTSIRDSLIPGTGIRMGYQCAIAFVYCVFAYRRGSARNVLASLFVFGVLMSGSNMSLLLTVSGAGGTFLFELIVAKKFTTAHLIACGTGAVVIGCILVMIARSDTVGFHNAVLESDAYADSIRSRLELNEEFLALAWEHPFAGNGISAAYFETSDDIVQTPHSAIRSTFVQTGILGLSAYLAFVGWLGYSGSMVLRKSLNSPARTYYLTMANYVTFFMLVMKAEVTGDMPGNRELWMMAALLIHCLVILQSTAGNSAGPRRAKSFRSSRPALQPKVAPAAN